MTTTIKAVKDALEALVVGLTPTGLALSQRRYIRASTHEDWSDRAASDVDRRFSVEVTADGGWRSFGTLTEHEATTMATIRIGHIKGQQVQSTIDRRDTDLRQLALEAQDPSNRPTGVWRIAIEPPVSITDSGQWWESELRFRVTFAEANP